MKLSKRKLESYRRAELVCRELRFQVAGRARNMDLGESVDLLINWMKVTGNIKYDRPNNNRRVI